MRNAELRDFLPPSFRVRIRGSQLLALPEQANLCPREGERQEERTDGAPEVRADVGTMPCVGQHVWAHLTRCGAAHRVCEDT